ncbi:MAG TPA: hypothetical protein VFY29_10875 [Terriglobia bacterium]|nr:hypothetical protein [Terriglobia bacterium]
MRIAAASLIGLLLLATFHLYRDAYFSLDDFNNLYWAQQLGAGEMAWHLINPVSTYYRPAGMAFYWVLLRLFDLNALAFHVVAWAMHAINTALVYLLLKRIAGARPGAAVGAAMFASQAAFADIYWNFGSVFELACACGIFGSLILWSEPGRNWTRVLWCTAILLFAVKAKEMALTVPVLWILSDLAIRSRAGWRMFAQALPAGVGVLVWGVFKFTAMREPGPAQLYYMDIGWISLGRGFATHFNTLAHLHWPWQLWATGAALLSALLLFLKSRRALFFELFTLVTFMPVIFLVNHRDAYLWYIPFVGVCGFAALATGVLMRRAESFWGVRGTSVAAWVAFPALCVALYAVQVLGSRAARAWQRPMTVEYRAFVSGMRAIDAPGPNERVFFDSHPLYFSPDMVRNATQVALRRTDIQVHLVSDFPADARYRLRFEGLRVERVP